MNTPYAMHLTSQSPSFTPSALEAHWMTQACLLPTWTATFVLRMRLEAFLR
jgi:hypothetical protein